MPNPSSRDSLLIPIRKFDPVYTVVSNKINAYVMAQETGSPLAPNAIHELRVLTKQLRAALQLYSAVVSKPIRTTMAHKIKQVADLFSRQRDLYVQQKTLTKLLKRSPHIMIQVQALYDVLGDTEKDTSMADALLVKKELVEIANIWARDIATDSTEFADRGLLKTFRKAEKLGVRAIEYDIDDDFHEWRKWAKYLYYQLLLSVASDQNAPADYLKLLKKLGDSLGVFHDYCVLENTVVCHRDKIEDQRAADYLVEKIAVAKQQQKTFASQQFKSLFMLSDKRRKSVLRVRL